MLRKPITYEDYYGETRTEEFRFNLTKAELTMLESSVDGGFQKMLKEMVSTKDAPKIMKTFEKIILVSYGVISPDGRRFIKSEELSKEFMQTPAYDSLFMELLEDGGKMAAFINGIMPKDVQEKLSEEGYANIPVK